MKARILPLFVVLIGFAWLGAGPGRTQEETVRSIPFEGPEVFAHILHSEGIKPIATFEEAFREKERENNLIIVFGNPSIVEKYERAGMGLSGFRYRGGNILIATDYQASLIELSMRVSGTQISQLEDAYRKTPDCPWLSFGGGKGRSFATDDAAEHPLFQSLQRGIATNRPSALVPTPIVPKFPGMKTGSDVETMLVIRNAGNADKGRFGGPPEYMAASRSNRKSRGRTLIVAGHGMFMNGMMLQDDNDNFEFARNAIRWLSEGKDGKTPRRALFIYEGRAITDFNMNLSPPPPPIPVPTMQMLNRLIKGLEEERFFHRVLAEMLGPQLLRSVVLVLLGIVTFSLILYGAKKLRAASAQVDTAAPSMVGAISTSEPLDTLKERQQAILRQGDFWGETHDLVLAWFHAEFDVTPEHWRAEVQARFQTHGSLLARWRLQRKADFALKLARAAKPMHVSRREFFALVDSLKELTLARQTGRLALLVEGKNVRQTLVASG